MVGLGSSDAAALFAGKAVPGVDPAELCSWLDAIAEITRAANRAAPLDELLDLIAGTTARLTGYEFCAVFVEDPKRQALIIKASYGLSQEYVDAINARTPIPLRAGDSGEGATSRAFRSLRPATVFDFPDSASRAWETVAAQQGYSSLLSVPLVVEQTPFGLLNCYTVDRHEFTAREIILMESLANQAGLAIETSHRLTQAREHARELVDMTAAMRAELAGFEHAEANHAELLRVVLGGGGMSAIAESLATRLECTVVIDDPTGHRLASASGTGERNGRAAAAHELARARMDADPHRATPASEARAGSDLLVVPVVLDEEVAGRLWALCPRTSFGAPHRRALNRAAAVVAFALIKERTVQEVEWRLSRDFFDELLSADGQADGQANGQPEALHARARQLGADLTEPQTLLVIRRDSARGEPNAGHGDREAYAQRSLLSLVQRTGAAWKGATLTAARSDHVVVLWRSPDAPDEHARSATEFAHHLRREILAYAGGWTATIAVGPRCVAVHEYADAYRITCGILDLAQLSDRPDRVVALDEIGAYGLLLQVNRPRELRSFARSMLTAVHEYDTQHQAKLALTLRTYMAHRCNATLTATTLHVHANTVSYRLRRVERVLGIHLDDPRALLHIQLALMIESILGDRVC